MRISYFLLFFFSLFKEKRYRNPGFLVGCDRRFFLSRWISTENRIFVFIFLYRYRFNLVACGNLTLLFVWEIIRHITLVLFIFFFFFLWNSKFIVTQYTESRPVERTEWNQTEPNRTEYSYSKIEQQYYLYICFCFGFFGCFFLLFRYVFEIRIKFRAHQSHLCYVKAVSINRNCFNRIRKHTYSGHIHNNIVRIERWKWLQFNKCDFFSTFLSQFMDILGVWSIEHGTMSIRHSH